MASTWGRTARIGGWMAAGLLGAALLAPFATAQSQTPSQQPSESPSDERPGPRDGRGNDAGRMHGRGRGHHKMGMPGAVHGEMTVRRDDAYVVVVFQRGTVTARSGSSFTVRSPDGFTSTWTLNDDTKIREGRKEATAAAITVGDEIGVGGEKTGSTVTTKHVHIRPADAPANDSSTSRAPAADEAVFMGV